MHAKSLSTSCVILIALQVVLAQFPKAPQTEGARTTQAKKLVRSLDTVLQMRFKTTTDRFGMSRMPVLSGHENIILSHDKNDDATLIARHLKKSGQPVLVGFAHIQHQPADTGTPIPKPGLVEGITEYTGSRYINLRVGTKSPLNTILQDFKKQITARTEDIKNGIPFDLTSKQTFVATRPVVTDRSCVQCHAGVKEDMSMGALVYVIPLGAKPKSK